jgi:hypothetical protein
MDKTFRVSVYESCGGFATIKAKNKKEAEAKANYILDNEGLAGFHKFESEQRETNVFGIEKV